ncbi:MAG: SCP2 sterol-binding domain-containing protein [Reinekea sp.]|jgi:ubiquinone biosynthesis protein UbiJ
MKLRLMLWLMAVLYKRAIRRNASMREYLADVEKTIQFTTDQRNVKRYLKFRDQKLASQSAEVDSADMTIRFRSAKEGFNVLWAMASGKDKNAFMRAIQDKQLAVEGDVTVLMWFQQSLRYIR